MNAHKDSISLLKTGLNLTKRVDTKFRTEGADLWSMLLKVVIAVFILIAIAITVNVQNFHYTGINVTLAFLSLFVGILAFTHPNTLITIANLDIVNRALPEKFQITALDAIFDTFMRIAKRIIAFACGTFLFLGIVPIGDNLIVFLVMLMSIILAILINSKTEVAKTKSERGK